MAAWENAPIVKPAAGGTGRELVSRNEVAGLTQPGSMSDPMAPGAAYLSNAGARPKMFADTERRLGTMDDASKQAQSMRVDANRFAELNKTEASGGLHGLIAPIRAPFDPGIAEMQAISERITPMVREAGSGAMSDRDVAMYRKSIPNMTNPRQANKALTAVIDAGARRESDFSAFMNEWARRNNSLVGADEAWRAYADANPLYTVEGENTAVQPTTPWRQWFGVEPPKTTPQAQASQRRRPAGPVSGLSPQQNALLGLTIGAPGMIMGSAPQPRQQAPRPAARQPSTSAAPRAGQVVDGYRFKGGDPSKPANWVKQ